MAADPVAVRVARAALRFPGVFAAADRFDPQWWARFDFAAAASGDEIRRSRASTRLLAEAAALGCPYMAEQSQKETLQAFTNAYGDWDQAHAPWLPKRGPEEALEAYRREVGDPEDPAFQAEMAKDTLEYRRRRAERLAAGGGSGGGADALRRLAEIDAAR